MLNNFVRKALLISFASPLLSCVSLSETENADQLWLAKAKKKAEFIFGCDSVKASAFEYIPASSFVGREKLISLIAVEGCGKRSIYRLLTTTHSPCDHGKLYVEVDRAHCDIYQDSSTISDEKKK